MQEQATGIQWMHGPMWQKLQQRQDFLYTSGQSRNLAQEASNMDNQSQEEVKLQDTQDVWLPK